MIDVVRHDLWHDRRYIEIMHSNWPRSIERWKCTGVLALSDPPDDEAVNVLRGGHVGYMVQTKDGTVYSAIGGGYSTSGMSVQVVRTCKKAELLLAHIEDFFKKQVGSALLVQGLDATTKSSRFHFRLALLNDGAYAMDEQSLLGFRLMDRGDCQVLYGDPSLPLRLWEERRQIVLKSWISRTSKFRCDLHSVLE